MIVVHHRCPTFVPYVTFALRLFHVLRFVHVRYTIPLIPVGSARSTTVSHGLGCHTFTLRTARSAFPRYVSRCYRCRDYDVGLLSSPWTVVVTFYVYTFYHTARSRLDSLVHCLCGDFTVQPRTRHLRSYLHTSHYRCLHAPTHSTPDPDFLRLHVYDTLHTCDRVLLPLRLWAFGYPRWLFPVVHLCVTPRSVRVYRRCSYTPAGFCYGYIALFAIQHTTTARYTYAVYCRFLYTR